MLTLTTVQLARRRYKGSVGDSHEIALSFGPTVVTCHVSCRMSDNQTKSASTFFRTCQTIPTSAFSLPGLPWCDLILPCPSSQ